MSLPNIFVFQSVAQYVRYVKENVANHGFLQLLSGSIVDPCSRFTAERANSGDDDGLVHIRSTYNNKYLVRQSSTSTWIMATAAEPEEDQSKWSCTLFSLTRSGSSSNRFFFMHVQLKRYLTHETEPSTRTQCLRASAETRVRSYIAFDWERIFVMPRFVSFRGNNGRYLSAREISNQRHLQFASTNITDPSCRFEVITMNDGSIRLRSTTFGTFWRRVPNSTNWILADGHENASGILFTPIKVEDNVIGIRNNQILNFCERANTTDVTRDCLRAISETISPASQLVLEEAVLSRRIDNVVYRLRDAKIRRESIIIMAINEAVNETQEDHDMQLNFTYSESKSSTWNTSVSASLGVSATFSTGIPFLVQKSITISAEISSSYEWGKTIEQSTEVSTAYDVIVPPKTKVTVRLVATEALFDVPFFYVQRDTLFDGSQVISESDDGIYHGVNSYNFRYEIEEQKLDPAKLMQQGKTPKIIETKAKVHRSAL